VYLRETRRTRKDGTTVRYLQLAHNYRDPDTVWAHATYDLLRRHLTGYHHATPDTIWRRFVSTRGRITIHPDGITAKLNNRTYSPVLRTAKLPPVTIPWWNNRTLTIEIGQPTRT
jgi:hypothetical protein